MEGRSHGTPPTAGAAPTRGPPSMILLGHWCAKDGQEARGCNMVDSPSIAWTSCWVRVYRVRIWLWSASSPTRARSAPVWARVHPSSVTSFRSPTGTRWTGSSGRGRIGARVTPRHRTRPRDPPWQSGGGWPPMDVVGGHVDCVFASMLTPKRLP